MRCPARVPAGVGGLRERESGSELTGRLRLEFKLCDAGERARGLAAKLLAKLAIKDEEGSEGEEEDGKKGAKMDKLKEDERSESLSPSKRFQVPGPGPAAGPALRLAHTIDHDHQCSLN